MNPDHAKSRPSRLSVFQRLDGVCDRFERALRAGQRPRIEDYLAEAGGGEQAVLLRWLLQLELEYRVEAGELIRIEQYQQRFPLHADLAAVVLAEVEATPPPGLAAGSRSEVQTLPPGLRAVVAASDAETPPVTPAVSQAQETATIPPRLRRLAAPAVDPAGVAGYEILGELGHGGMGVGVSAWP